MLISDIVEWNGRKYPNKTALVHDSTRISFAELNKRTNRLVHGLRDLGVKKGDRIAILADSCHQYAELALALPKGGMIAVPLNYRFTPEELAYVVNDSGAETLVVDDNFKSSFDAARPYLKGVKNLITIGEPSPGMKHYNELISQYPSEKLELEANETDIVYLIYTSGTTARPKGVMHSHKSMVANAIAFVVLWRITPRDIFSLLAPPFHMMFFWGVITLSYIGCTIVIKRWDPGEFLKLVEREKITYSEMVPAWLRALVEYPELSKYDFSSLRRVGHGASPITEDLRKRVESIFTGVRIEHEYGMTECPIITAMPAEELDAEGRRLPSCGKAVVNCEVRVVDEADKDVVPGQAGEIIVKGDGVTSGYWNLPEETAKSLKEGYLYSGDIAKVDEDGYIYIVDRAKDMIITGGENVYCPEVENVLSSHPAVLEAAVIGVPDEKWGEMVKALVILKSGMTATEEEIIEFCRPRIAGYKRPKSVDFYEDFPRTSVGKVSKKDLREKYWAGYERRVH